MNKAWIAISLGITTMGCASQRDVARAVSDLEMRRLAVENAMAARVTKVEQVAATALSVATEAKKEAQGKFIYDTILGKETISFSPADGRLSAEAQARLSTLVGKLKAANRNVFLEIEGHTDSLGQARFNDAIGLRRAEAVRAFLFAQGVALNRMSTISLGEYVPVAPNTTARGRAQNRRVVIVIKG